MAQVKVYQTMVDSKYRFKRICNDCSKGAYMQWILEHIPCEGEGIIARDYMADPASGFPGLTGEDIDLSLIRCTV